MAKNQKKIRVCGGKNCKSLGSEKIMKFLENTYDLKAGESNSKIDLDYSGCMGNCDFAPNVTVDGKIITNANIETILEKIDQIKIYDTSIQTNEKKIDEILEDDLLGEL